MPTSMQRPVVIAGNWKMNHGAAATKQFFAEFLELLDSDDGKAIREAVAEDRLRARVFPPFLSLQTALSARGIEKWLYAGAQNVHWKDSGAFTGEISTGMLSEIGVRHMLAGHSERRQYFGETDETVRLRTLRGLEEGFEVIVCVGETLAERDAGSTEEVLLRQLIGVFPQIGKDAAAGLDGRILIAYEPVWAIGTGRTATPEQAQEAHRFIRHTLRERLGEPAANATPLLYGGSVKPDNIGELIACQDVDGALVGGASLKAADFMALLVAGAKPRD